MAARRRSKRSERVSLNCFISAESKLYLMEFAGEQSLGWAVERLVDVYRATRNATTTLQNVASNSRPQ